MHKPSRLLLLLPLAAILMGGPVNLNTQVRFEFTNCASGGSNAQTVAGGSYLMRVTDRDTFVCFAASTETDGGAGAGCATLGEKFPVGTVMLIAVGSGGSSVSCRSSDSTGDVILTKAG